MNILPPFAETDFVEVQVFDNRHQTTTKARTGKAAMKVKISTLTAPGLDLGKAIRAVNGAAMQPPAAFVKSVQKRVSSKTLTPERAAEVRGIARESDRFSLVGLIKENDICVVLHRDDRFTPLSVTLHYADGRTIFVEDGFGRDETASPNAAIWRQYYDPNGFHGKHGSGPILAALNRKVPKKTSTSVSDEVVAELRRDMDTLISSLHAVLALVEEQNTKIAALSRHNADPATSLAALEAPAQVDVVEAPSEPTSAFDMSGFISEHTRRHGVRA